MELSFTQAILGFSVCSATIVYAGTRLSRYGDRLAELTGIGKAWIGLIVMASVTSLPELITGISSVTIVNAPDLAAGDIFGSCVFNLLILSVLDAFMKKPLTSMVQSSHILAGSFGIILISLAGIGMLFPALFPLVGWVSTTTFIIFGIYFAAIWLIFKFEQKNSKPMEASAAKMHETDGPSLKKTLTLYGLNALIVVLAALFLPYLGEIIALESGLGNTFFGTLFIAATTSLPELVVSISAVRMGSVDLAVGNLFGSNIFNIFILGLDDLFYLQGSIYSHISSNHLLSVFVVIMMTAVAAIGLLFKAERKKLLLAFDTMIILLLYAALMAALWRMQ